MLCECAAHLCRVLLTLIRSIGRKYWPSIKCRAFAAAVHAECKIDPECFHCPCPLRDSTGIIALSMPFARCNRNNFAIHALCEAIAKSAKNLGRVGFEPFSGCSIDLVRVVWSPNFDFSVFLYFWIPISRDLIMSNSKVVTLLLFSSSSYVQWNHQIGHVV